MAKEKREARPMETLVSGIILSVIGGTIIAASSSGGGSTAGLIIGGAVAGLGSTFLLVGVIATGIVIGMREHRYDWAERQRQ